MDLPMNILSQNFTAAHHPGDFYGAYLIKWWQNFILLNPRSWSIFLQALEQECHFPAWMYVFLQGSTFFKNRITVLNIELWLVKNASSPHSTVVHHPDLGTELMCDHISSSPKSPPSELTLFSWKFVLRKNVLLDKDVSSNLSKSTIYGKFLAHVCFFKATILHNYDLTSPQVVRWKAC